MTSYNDISNLSDKISDLYRLIKELQTQPRAISTSIDRGGTQSSDYDGTGINSPGTTGWMIGTDETTGVGYVHINGTHYTNGGWATYVPTLTAITIGSGTVTARWTSFGKVVHARGMLTLGAGTVIGANARVSLPVAPLDLNSAIGSVLAHDFNLGAHVSGTAESASGNTALAVFSSGRISATIPFTWADGDQLSWMVTYESA